MKYAFPVVGRTGLANMLFPWARAEMYCRAYGARMILPRWTNLFRIGPWLRRERDKRYYFNAFTGMDMIGGWRREFLLHALPHIGETEVRATSSERTEIVLFQGMEGYFSPFLAEQPWLARRLEEIAHPMILQGVERVTEEPFIGVHVRRGDFMSGGIAIPDSWYLQAIFFARERFPGLPIHVFSDAPPETLGFLSIVDDLTFMPSAPALHDLLVLSRAKMIVGTSRSTFSMWAVFLGQMPSIWHPCEKPPAVTVSKMARVYVLES